MNIILFISSEILVGEAWMPMREPAKKLAQDMRELLKQKPCRLEIVWLDYLREIEEWLDDLQEWEEEESEEDGEEQEELRCNKRIRYI